MAGGIFRKLSDSRGLLGGGQVVKESSISGGVNGGSC